MTMFKRAGSQMQTTYRLVQVLLRAGDVRSQLWWPWSLLVREQMPAGGVRIPLWWP